MKKRFFPVLIGLSALLVSGSAAFYSVFGLSKLFAGASTQVIIMAGSLEFAKLVVASLLYQYWSTINKWLRTYLSIAVFVLMVITSGGIYGFLSGAYQETATKSEFLDKSLVVLQTKQNRFEEQKTDLNVEKTQLNKTISDLRISLSNPAQVSYYDKEAEKVITTTSSSTRRALQAELKTTIQDRDKINLKLESVMDSVMRIDGDLLELEINNEDQRELGPLKYLSETTGYPMGQVVNWFLLLIIFVFDPLAIAMVVAANFAFAQIRRKDDELTGGQLKMYPLPSHLDRWPSTKLKQRVKENQERLKEDTSEKRMNIIGQNGNDGLHYEEESPKEETIKYPTTDEIIAFNRKENELKEDIQPLESERLEEEIWLPEIEETQPTPPEDEKVELSIEKEEKEIIVKEESRPLSSKEAIKIKQQAKLQQERSLIYRNNR
jgi:hypothetical protein